MIDLGGSRRKTELRSAIPLGSALVFAFFFSFSGMARLAAQVAPSAEREGVEVFAGATASGGYLQYGERWMFGVGGTVEVENRHHFGYLAAGQWLDSRQSGTLAAAGNQAQIRTATYLGGPRYHLSIGRFAPYLSGLVGLGRFSFPYHDGQVSCLVVGAGAGVDLRLNQRLRLRLADFEYNQWPNFPYGSMNAYSLSAGVRLRIF
jgi:hypothetical protein